LKMGGKTGGRGKSPELKGVVGGGKGERKSKTYYLGESQPLAVGWNPRRGNGKGKGKDGQRMGHRPGGTRKRGW